MNVVSSLQSDELYDKNGKKVDDVYRKVNPNNPEERGNEKERNIRRIINLI